MAEYIEKNAAIAKLTMLEVKEPLSTMIDAKRMLADMPAADVAPVRRGHWIKCGYACGEAEFKCSLCGEIEWRTNETDYCPNCGAKIDEEEESCKINPPSI